MVLLFTSNNLDLSKDEMYQIVFYVPASHLELTKTALFNAGAGAIGAYEHCCWQVLGQGQFIPTPSARPFLGQVDTLVQVDEYRVELVCADDKISAAAAALRLAHPYEEPAMSCWRLEEL